MKGYVARTKEDLIVRNRADLIRGINMPVLPRHCARCGKGVITIDHNHYRGFCFECASNILDERRCTCCFSKVHEWNQSFDWNLEKVCIGCSHKQKMIGGNEHGIKEGPDKEGNKTNHWTSNQNDDLVKIYEK